MLGFCNNFFCLNVKIHSKYLSSVRIAAIPAVDFLNIAFGFVGRELETRLSNEGFENDPHQ